MTDKGPSPFAGLDKALLRSTEPPRSTTPQEAPTPAAVESTPVASPAAAPSKLKASKPASHLASNRASLLASYPEDWVEIIRKAVKVPGREVSFVRLSADEKRRLSEVVYACKQQGKKTTENGVNRIAINVLLQDYEANGKASFLARVLASLLS